MEEGKSPALAVRKLVMQQTSGSNPALGLASLAHLLALLSFLYQQLMPITTWITKLPFSSLELQSSAMIQNT